MRKASTMDQPMLKDARPGVCVAFHAGDTPDPKTLLCWTTSEQICASALTAWLYLWQEENRTLERLGVESSRADEALRRQEGQP